MLFSPKERGQGIAEFIAVAIIALIIVLWISRISFGCRNWINILDKCVK